MSFRKLCALTVLATPLVGCGGGDINISPSTADNSVDNSTTTNTVGNNNTTPVTYTCAKYTEISGATRQGSYDTGTGNCTYSKGFVDVDKPLLADLTIPNIGKGVHIFEGSLFVGKNYPTIPEAAAAGIREGGDGPILTIEAGNTLAFRSNLDFVSITRGSQIRANGTATAPIIFTSYTDAVLKSVGPEDVSEWGGIVVTGFGITNACSYTGTYPALTMAGGDCSIRAEGRAAGDGETHYGGNNNADNSGVLRYVIVKHTGALVSVGNELNGFGLAGVGSGTIVENIQSYAAFDDSLEIWGGAVNVTNYVGMYGQDDYIDLDEGWKGTITNALLIQGRDGGSHCVEADGIAGYSGKAADVRQDFIDRGLNTRATLKNVTCLVSPQENKKPGDLDPGTGLRLREGFWGNIQNLLITTAYRGDTTLGNATLNYCLNLDGTEVLAAAAAGNVSIRNSVFACSDLTANRTVGGQSDVAWLRGLGNAVYQSAEAGENPTAASNPNLVILDAFYSVPVASMKAGSEVIPAPAAGTTFIGGILKTNDWASGWTYGINPANRGQALWFQ
jgi:hypothetical protein